MKKNINPLYHLEEVFKIGWNPADVYKSFEDPEVYSKNGHITTEPYEPNVLTFSNYLTRHKPVDGVRTKIGRDHRLIIDDDKFKKGIEQANKYRQTGAVVGGLLGAGLGATVGNAVTSKVIKKKDLKQLKYIVLKSDSCKQVINVCQQLGLDKVLPKYIKYIDSLSNDPKWKQKTLKKINIKLTLPVVAGALGGVAGGYLGHQGGAHVGADYHKSIYNSQPLTDEELHIRI